MRLDFTLSVKRIIGGSLLLVHLLFVGNARAADAEASSRMAPEEEEAAPFSSDQPDIKRISRSPLISVQQLLKGQVAGLYVQENNGEPGTVQSMILRGAGVPLFLNRDISEVQPTVYLNGVPLVDYHPFSSDIQLYDVNRPGTATNLLAGVDISNIESIEVIKNPASLAKLGPLAANGAIFIRTKERYNGKEHFSVDARFGMSLPPANIRPTNAVYEREFRQKFFDTYSIADADRYMPEWLRDAADRNYSTDSKWANDYYRYAPNFSVNASLAGNDRYTDYIFMAGATSLGGVADRTNYEKYNIDFAMNIRPLTGLEFNLRLSGNMGSRTRNRNFRDRYAEMQILPDLGTPVSPTEEAYRQILDLYDEGEDNNKSNLINALLGVRYTTGKFNVASQLKINYNTDNRHVFYASALTEAINYVSDYNAYARRVVWNSTADFQAVKTPNHRLNAGLDATILADLHHYSFIRGYDGDNDKNQSSSSGSFLKYYYLDKEVGNLASFSGYFDYSYKDLLTAGVVLRSDGYSKVQSDHRWLFTPAFSLQWNLRNTLMPQSPVVSGLNLSASWARIGRLATSDRHALGPQYTSSELNWIDQSPLSSYNGFSSLTRPYSSGWIGYDQGWPYSEQAAIDLDASFWGGRLMVAASVYRNTEKDLIVNRPTTHESGHHFELSQGMEIDNRGIDLSVASTLASGPQWKWSAQANVNHNRSELIKLPGGQNEMELNGRKLIVGEPVDRFWLLENQGISSGNPIWRDVNRDQTIDDSDKVLTGNSLPKITGGLASQFEYGRFDFGFHLFFAAGHQALNARSAQRYGFMTLDTQNSLDAVREIFFWQNTNDRNDYPIYNPLGTVNAYRADQDLFLENASFLKLRSVTLGYTFTLSKGENKSKTNNAHVYISGTNLLTITDFSGDDPELVDFNGIYRGYSQPIPAMIIVGGRLKF
jgi:TonB-linked SusC/RagA family outer membrane protein